MMRLDHARRIAEALVERLRPACERIEIAGSIRRQARAVRDIELVTIPKLERRPVAGQASVRHDLEEFAGPVKRWGVQFTDLKRFGRTVSKQLKLDWKTAATEVSLEMPDKEKVATTLGRLEDVGERIN